MLSHNKLPLVPSMLLGELKQLGYLALHSNPLMHYAPRRLTDHASLLASMRALHSSSGFGIVLHYYYYLV
jgi:hypothetical protein